MEREPKNERQGGGGAFTHFFNPPWDIRGFISWRARAVFIFVFLFFAVARLRRLLLTRVKRYSSLLFAPAFFVPINSWNNVLKRTVFLRITDFRTNTFTFKSVSSIGCFPEVKSHVFGGKSRIHCLSLALSAKASDRRKPQGKVGLHRRRRNLFNDGERRVKNCKYNSVQVLCNLLCILVVNWLRKWNEFPLYSRVRSKGSLDYFLVIFMYAYFFFFSILRTLPVTKLVMISNNLLHINCRSCFLLRHYLSHHIDPLKTAG